MTDSTTPIQDTPAEAASSVDTEHVDTEHLAQIRQISTEFAPSGVLHLILEVLAYSVDEAGKNLVDAQSVVTLHADNSVSISDNGSGTDARYDGSGNSSVSQVMALKDPRFFDSPGTELLSDGFSRRGISVVTALSDWLIHTKISNNNAWGQRYEEGVPLTGQVDVAGEADTTGTTVQFLPIESLREGFPVDADHLRELAVFPFLKVEILDRRITPPDED